MSIDPCVNPDECPPLRDWRGRVWRRAAAPPELQSLIPGMILTVLAMGMGMGELSAMAVGLSAYALIRFLLMVGNGIPIDSFILLVAALQWLVAPLLSYAGFAPHPKYHMYVDEQEYFSLAVPATACLAIGMGLFRSRRQHMNFPHLIEEATAIVRRNRRLPLALMVIGGACAWVGGFVPPSLGFVFFLLGNVLYVGIILVLFSNRQDKWWLFAGALLWMFLVSLRHTIFHDLLLWIAMIGLYFAVRDGWSVMRRILMLVGFGVIVFVLNTVKIEIREYLASHGSVENKVELFSRVLDKKFMESETIPIHGGEVGSLIIRLNQGWIVSRVMQRIPAYRPFANGKTIRMALQSAMLPRFLNQDKLGAGGHALFTRFTDFPLYSASMGLSLLGEGYGNYGKGGAMMFLLVYGAFISLLLRLYWAWTCRHPIGVFWVPLMFLHAVKAETDFVVVLNFLVKGLILTVVMVWLTEKFLGATPSRPEPMPIEPEGGLDEADANSDPAGGLVVDGRP